jgi:AcrR family transcriptional regulator
MTTDTKDRIMLVTSELFRRQGMNGTGLKQITREAQAPFGSLYHFFPGGKEQLAEEVIRTSGKEYFELVIAVFDASPDLLAGIASTFEAAAALLIATDYADACPIAAIALEVASTDGPLRSAVADVFTDWIESGTRHFDISGLSLRARRRLVISIITGLEGAFVLSRALRSIEPLEVAGQTVLNAARAELLQRLGEGRSDRNHGKGGQDDL